MIRILPRNSLKEMNDVKTTSDNFNFMFVLIIVLKNISMLLVREKSMHSKILKKH